MTVAVVDYGAGNVGSLVNVLGRLGASVAVTCDPTEIRGAGRVIIPGVGAFDPAIDLMRAADVLDALGERARDGVPILGVCLGMQVLANGSDEGHQRGLGLIPGRVRRLGAAGNATLRLPHMGWNRVLVKRDHPLFEDLDPAARFYFAHSYGLECSNDEDVLATTYYGTDFVSAVQRDNVIGIQFHPEKSHRHGLRLLERFLGL